MRAWPSTVISIRLACVVYGISETCYRYQAKLNGENDLIVDRRCSSSRRPQALGLRAVSLVIM